MGYQYQDPAIRYFDNDRNLIYLSQYGWEENRRKGPKIDHSRMVNIQVFNENTGASKKLFENDLISEKIGGMFFEKRYDEKNRKLIYCGEEYRIRNNEEIDQRELNDRILVYVLNDETHETTFFVFNKEGEDQKTLLKIESKAEWFIDVYHQKIRIIKETHDSIQMQSISW